MMSGSGRGSTLIFRASMLAALLLSMPYASYCQNTSPLIEDSQPVWSPDGKRIAFVSTRPGRGAASSEGKNIWVVNADGTGLRQLTSGGTMESPTWSPDGAQIAYHSGGQLYTVDVKSPRILQLTQGGKGWFWPDWHPKDANKLLCAARIRTLSDNDIYLLNPQTCFSRPSGRVVLREREGRDERPRWSRDGSKLAFIGEVMSRISSDTKWYLCTMRPDGTGLKTYCQVTKPNSRPSWFPDGSAIMFEDGKVCDLATSKVSSPFTQPILEPDISPDGKRVAFCEIVAGKGRFIFTSKLDGSDKVQITSP